MSQSLKIFDMQWSWTCQCFLSGTFLDGLTQTLRRPNMNDSDATAYSWVILKKNQ